MQWLAIFIGAGFGACLRAWLGRFNSIFADTPSFAWLPLGTLFANVLGGLLMGVALVLFQQFAETINPNIKMMIATGFLGGLTTFSTFSAEVFTLLNDGKVIFALALVLLHVLITLLALALAFYSLKMFFSL